MDVNGMWGGYIDAGAKTVLPSQAHAKISCRLVPNQDPIDIEAKIRAHIAEHCPEGLKIDFVAHHGGIPFVVNSEAPALDAAKAALGRVWGTEAVMLRSGGSIPVVASFKEMMGLDSVMMGLGLPDDRLHSPNEKFSLECYFNGIRSSAYIFEELGKV
jgi:acetylornithine deacetylase/succinyl-diaminopimelate desuccinylase-like protein